ncbi:complex I subunit 4 family protein [Chryseolinea lacunae]|uniref:NADH-quinone oxidoreductase subunit M n=1 Tax=Chryseolinea lacunae TaxID=2801331 RepID=A0ABS1L052_9BACT|nr:NADH-quinone oxidoreductase subunit M [Chryseolinea lacunae]MBL0744882.1 NADH-quinone oxidoreductase subunit M [Chryseolinea lacunae]
MMILFLLSWPLLASLLLFAFKPKQAWVVAFVASLIELVASLVLVFQFDKSAAVEYAINVPWIASLGVNFAIGFDGISLLLVLLTTVLVPFIILSSTKHSYSSAFYGLVLMMQMALIGVFTAMDGFLFYLFWEIALIPIYFICLIWGGEDRGRITLKFFIYTLAGSLLMLVALIYLYFQTPGSHSFEIQALYEAGRALPLAEQGFIFWGLFIAFAIKMPVFPFHTWQPDTYSVAPSQGTMLLSGIMLKMGLYGVIRWLVPVVPAGVHEWGMTAVVLSVIGIIYGSCIAIVQKDFKRLIAYSSIAHVGLISAGIFTLNKIGVQGALIQMLSHGILVFGLFYGIDIIETRVKTRTLSALGGIRHVAPVFSAVFTVVMLGTLALPFTSGFVGEFLLINSIFQYNAILGAVGGLTIILGAVYMLRSFQQAMLGETNSTTESFVDLSGREKLVLFPIVVIIIVMGIYPDPLLSISESAVTNLLSIVQEFSASAK